MSVRECFVLREILHPMCFLQYLQTIFPPLELSLCHITATNFKGFSEEFYILDKHKAAHTVNMKWKENDILSKFVEPPFVGMIVLVLFI